MYDKKAYFCTIIAGCAPLPTWGELQQTVTRLNFLESVLALQNSNTVKLPEHGSHHYPNRLY